ncbi:hypothetical protein BC936DRAFT_149947 [Jimgerdemannia flammicorona]|uniref:Uncharacterized protein n=1 Tax=Jimgerdemannia flammicorona TaxID=994334 RepID=A0A433CZT8_9FUNG|nr:hypothetical protein BC936DRAFT_149947 [Jimgerdemannia flammicorona]
MDTINDTASQSFSIPDGYRTFRKRKYMPSANTKYVLPSIDDSEMVRLDYQHYVIRQRPSPRPRCRRGHGAQFTQTPCRPGIRGHFLGLRVGSHWLERSRWHNNENLCHELLGDVQTGASAKVETRRRRVLRVGSNELERSRRRNNEKGVQTNGNAKVGTRRRRVH